ncbi:MAG: AMIN domain-containing protein [Candidatus Sericytochromatia bacterium]|nr:AMIN domain-containing protein [Candidatus Sericytochromatia bacterium]
MGTTCHHLLRLALSFAAVFPLLTWGAAVPADASRQRGARPVRPVLVQRLAYDAQRHTIVLGVTGHLGVATRTVANPLRLVVDLPGARLATRNRALTVGDPLVARVRVAQFAVWPPVVRVVIEPTGPDEPRLAVQQDGRRLYITVAPPTAQPAAASPQPLVPAAGPPEEAAGDLPLSPLPVLTAPPAILLPATPGLPPASSSVPPLTRPGIQQRLRPAPATAPAKRNEADAWPLVLPQGRPVGQPGATPGDPRAPLAAPPTPVAPPNAAPLATPPGGPEAAPFPAPGADAPLETDPFPTPVPAPPQREPGPGSVLPPGAPTSDGPGAG